MAVDYVALANSKGKAVITKELNARDNFVKKEEKTSPKARKSEKSRFKKFLDAKLKKPSASPIKAISPEKVLTKGLPQRATLVREGRTGYFNNEMAKEIKWLS